MKRAWLPAGLFLAGLPAVYIYSRACGLGFFADDFVFLHLLENKGPRFLAAYFCRLMDGNFFRPAAAVPWFLGHALGNSAFIHHLISVFLHVLNSTLGGFLCFRVLVRLDGADHSKAFTGGLVSTIIFLFSPAQSEAVFWISGKFDLLCVFFALLSFLAYLAHVEKPSAVRLVLVFWLVLFSLLSKETGITFVLGLVVLEILIRGKSGRERNLHLSAISCRKNSIQRAAAVGFGLLVYFLFRVGMQENFLPEGGLSLHSVAGMFEHAWIVLLHLAAPVWPAEGGTLVPQWAFVSLFALFLLLFLFKEVRGWYYLFVLALLVFPLLPGLLYDWQPAEWVGSRLLYPALPGWSILWGSGLASCLNSRNRKRVAALVLLGAYVFICVLQLHFNLGPFQSADEQVKNVLECLSQTDASAATEKIYLWDFPAREKGVMLFFRDAALTAAARRALPEEKIGKRYWGRRIFAYHGGRTGEESYIMALPDPDNVKNKKTLVIKWDKDRGKAKDITAILHRAYIRRAAKAAGLNSPLPALKFADTRMEGYFPVNHLNKTEKAGTYRITGNDPFFFTTPLDLEILLVQDVKIKIKMQPAGVVSPLHVQLYWRSKGRSFTENLSVIIPVPPGENILEKSVPLGRIPDFVLQKDIAQLRLDPPGETGYIEIIEFSLVPVRNGHAQ